MGKPIPYDFRAKIAQRKQSGDSYMDIALDLGLSESAVKKIWYKYLKEGESAFHTKHNNCGRTSPYGQDIRDAVEGVRDNMQGAEYVHSKLSAKHPGLTLPSARTLQRWWAAEGTGRPKGRVASEKKGGGASKPTKPGK